MARPALEPIAPFFRSTLQAALITRMVDPLGSWVSMSELASAGRSHQSARLELQRLVDAGIVERDTTVRPQRYRIPEDGPLSALLRELVHRTVGVEPRLRIALRNMPGVRAAALFGSWATSTVHPYSDIDVLVLTDDPGVDIEQLRGLEADIERATGRELDLVVFPVAEARTKFASGSGFLRTVLDSRLIPLVGDVREEVGE